MLFVFLYLLTRYMRPEGPWQRLAAALADSSVFSRPLYLTESCPQPLWVILGRPFLLLPKHRPTKEKVKVAKRQREETKEKYILGDPVCVRNHVFIRVQGPSHSRH